MAFKMGITGFAKFVEERFPDAIENTTIRGLSVKGRIAVDGYNECYVQMHVAKTGFVRGMTPDEVFEYYRDESRRDGFFNQIRKIWITRIIDFVITDLQKAVVWVFDGENVPRLKDEIREERRKRTNKNKEVMTRQIEKLDSDDFPNQLEYRRVLEEYLTSKPPTFEDYQILTAVLINIGIPVVRAWGEGEKTCARLCIPELTTDPELICTAVWSADVDSILFGAPVLIQRKRTFGFKEGSEAGQLRIFTSNKIDIPIQTLIKICVATGCDYLPKGIPGLGLKKAYKLYGTEETNTEFPNEYLDILDMFSHDPETEKDTRLTIENIPSKVSTDSLLRWFVTMYK